MKKIISFILVFMMAFSMVAIPQATTLASNDVSLTKITNLKITTANKKKLLKLTWDKQPDADGYQIYRSTTGKTGSYQRIASARGKTCYVDKGLKAAKTYYYKVRPFANTGSKTSYGSFKKVDLSTRLTKKAFQKRLVAANKFYIGWMLHCFEAWDCMDESDTQPIPGADCEWEYYIRVKSNRFHCVADLKKEASKHFTKRFYEEYIDDLYADINGKLYIKNYDHGGDGGPCKGTMKFVSLSDTSCKVKVTSTDPNSDFSYSFLYKMVYSNGKWLFQNMTDSFSIYYQGNDYWK